MVTYCTTSDVKSVEAERHPLHAADLPLAALPNVSESSLVDNVNTGASTNSVLSRTNDKRCWYALRTTYGRERKAYDYLTSHGVEAYLPLLKSVKMIGGKRTTIVESRIPNIFFARGTEDELKVFVYDNVNLPFLRFYYKHIHQGNKIGKEPMIVPDCQIRSLQIICNKEDSNILVLQEDVERFQKGEKVRVVEGGFAGVTGKVARYRGQQRVGVVIEGLLTVVTAYIPTAFLEKII